MAAAIYVLTIGGVTRKLQRRTLRLRESANRISTLEFAIVSMDGSVVPEIGEEVILTENGTRIFGGSIDTPSREHYGGTASDRLITWCHAVDFNELIDRRALNIIVAAGPMEDSVNALGAYLDPHGVTIDPAQITGPTLPAQEFRFMPLRKACDLLAAQTGLPYEVTYDKLFRMFDPAGEPCPFDVVDGDGHSLGKIEIEPTREDFANRVHVLGGTGTSQVTDTFTGDGSTDAFDLNYSLVGTIGYVTCGANNETLGETGSGAEWIHTMVMGTSTITRTTPPDNLDAISITYTAQFPKLVTVTDGAPATVDLVEKIIHYPDVFDYLVLTEIANKILDVVSVERDKAVYLTRELGVRPGQTQTITQSALDVDDTFTIRDVEMDDSTGIVQRRVTAVQGEILPGSWMNDIETWGASSAGGGSLPPTQAVVTSTGAAPPNKAVQFNRNGSFGGDSAFTYDEATNVLICSEDSTVTPTATNGQVFGKNCHVVNP